MAIYSLKHTHPGAPADTMVSVARAVGALNAVDVLRDQGYPLVVMPMMGPGRPGADTPVPVCWVNAETGRTEIGEVAFYRKSPKR